VADDTARNAGTRIAGGEALLVTTLAKVVHILVHNHGATDHGQRANQCHQVVLRKKRNETSLSTGKEPVSFCHIQ
jgi:hypothetical protein